MPKKQETKNQENKNPIRQIAINAQYIKDLSFENPNAPASLAGSNEAPKIDVSVDIRVQNLKDDTFEVVLVINSQAKAGKHNIFVIELAYAGVFTINVPEQDREAVLMIYCPGVIFPFARRILADISRDGGFPPLMLDPIDFASLYAQHKNKKKA